MARRRATITLWVSVMIIVCAVALSSLHSLAWDPSLIQLPRGYVLVEKARYYGGAQAAFVFRVDDYTVDSLYLKLLPDDFARPTRYYRNYQSILVEHITKNYPWLRLTLGVITSCPSGSCSVEWSLLNRLVQDYGWEAASHTRLHTRPPRYPQDYLGAVDDIESNITGYRVLTYIEPFGDTGPGELEDLAGRGVKIMMDSLPGIPEPLEFEDSIVRLHFTVKAADHLPWKPLLEVAIKEALVNGGVVVFYTHATSYDWQDPKDLVNAIDYVASTLWGERVWVTTPGELYSYLKVYEASRVKYHVEGGSLVVDVAGDTPAYVWKVPLTIIIYTGEAKVEGVEANGKALPRLESSWPLSRPAEGYMVGNGYIAVSVYPPARVTVKLEGADYLVLPRSVIDADWVLAKARLASLALWAPIVGRAALAYREARKKALLEGSPGRKLDDVRYVVVVPARNASNTIREVLESILRQTARPSAIAIVDDASTDGTAEKAARLLRSLGGSLVRVGVWSGYEELVYDVGGIRVYIVKSRRHRGKAFNVNVAVEALSRTEDIEYVMIVDSDTVLDPLAAERMLARLGADPRAALATGLVLLWRPQSGGRLSRALAAAFRNIGGAVLALGLRFLESLSGSLGGSSGAVMMVRVDVFKRLGGLPEDSLAEDTVFTWRLQLEGYKAVFAQDAVAYTVDPGGLAGLARKAARISAGLFEGAASLLPKALARGRPLLAATMAYNALGGLPIALAVAHLTVTAALLATGAYAATTAFKLALLLPHTPLALLLLALVENPLAYVAAVYASSAVEAAIAVIVLINVHKENRKAAEEVRKSLKYTPLFPLILWTNALAAMAGILYALYRLVTGRRTAKW